MLIGAKPAEIIFTSCGTEANNWAIRGLLAAHKRKGSHLVISAIEHPSIGLVARRLELEAGVRVSILPADREGLIAPASLRDVITPETVLVSVMLANGEVGTIEPVAELAAIAHEHGALFHTDAVAAAGYLPLDVKALKVDALSLAANTFGGPAGAAALYLREGVRILPLLEGGGQETGARSGTEALPAIVGMGTAAELARQRIQGTGPAAAPPHLSSPRRTIGVVGSGQVGASAPRHPSPNFIERLAQLRDQLCDGLKQRIERIRFNGSWTSRLPHNLHVCFDGLESEALILGLDQAGIAAGLGSACNSKAMRPSAVLKAMGLNDEQAKGAVVFTLGWQTTEAEISQALEIIPGVIARLRRVIALTARESNDVR